MACGAMPLYRTAGGSAGRGPGGHELGRSRTLLITRWFAFDVGKGPGLLGHDVGFGVGGPVGDDREGPDR